VAAGWAVVVWALPVSAPVTVATALLAAGCALAVRWLTELVTLATVDAGAAGWLACAASG
jgi:hypothetical protein